jgi:hypothetical protein
MDPDPEADPDPSIFIIDLQDANKKLILKKIFCIEMFHYAFMLVPFFTYNFR